MRKKPISSSRSGLSPWVVGAVLGAAAWLCGSASAQPAAEPAPAAPRPLAIADGAAPPPAEAPHIDPNVVPAGCSTCASGLLGGGSGGCGSGACGGGCVPGHNSAFCCGCNADTCVGRALCGLYDCICCPDPCYEPKWLPVADSAFFVDAARPVTQMRFRWDSGFGLNNPDRAEYFWVRENTNPTQTVGGAGKGPRGIASSLDYQSLSLYTEAAAGAFGFFAEVPYEHLDPDTAGISDTPMSSVSGFADMNLGTKAMLLDCQLLQLTFQFKTFLPTGNFLKGLGTGHVSLEPSLLFSVRLTPDDYLQGQLAYWIPIGGDSAYEGNIFHAHLSYNHVLCEPFAGLTFVGTLECNEWSVCNGRYTDPTSLLGVTPVALPAASTMFSAGPGVRMFVCNKIDFGVGTAFALSGVHWADELIRAEFRWRF